MKKNKKIGLGLNKKVISTLHSSQVIGGTSNYTISCHAACASAGGGGGGSAATHNPKCTINMK
nr:hypothetical protein [Allomuricauda sp.]